MAGHERVKLALCKSFHFGAQQVIRKVIFRGRSSLIVID
jgi:hypothetical protein